MKTILLISTLFHISELVTGQNIFVQNLTESHLSSPRYAVATFYDGDDSIYIFGGHLPNDRLSNEILKFSISTEEIEIVGHLTQPSAFFVNTVGRNSAGNFIIFHTRKLERLLVTEFNPVTKESKLVANYFLNFWDENYSPFAQIIENNSVVMMGDRRSFFEGQVMQIDLTNFEEVYHHNVFFNVSHFSHSAYDNVNEIIYAAVNDGTGTNTYYMTKMGVSQNDYEIIREIPIQNTYYRSFWNNGKMFIIDSHDKNSDDTPGISIFNPLDLSLDFYAVDGMTRWVGHRGVAFVPKLNRVYIFGGYLHTGNPADAFYDNVWFIDF